MGAKAAIRAKFLAQCAQIDRSLDAVFKERTKRGAVITFHANRSSRPVDLDIAWEEMLDLIASPARLRDFIAREIPGIEARWND